VAKRNAAIHAAGSLVAEFLLLHVGMKLLPVAHAHYRCPVHGQFPQILDESSWFTHWEERLKAEKLKAERLKAEGLKPKRLMGWVVGRLCLADWGRN
jgi:hypothetical protein